jgi:hypothetical protein
MSTNTNIKEKLIDYHKYLMAEIESYGSSLYPADYDRGAYDALTEATERLYNEFLRDVPIDNLYE